MGLFHLDPDFPEDRIILKNKVKKKYLIILFKAFYVDSSPGVSHNTS